MKRCKTTFKNKSKNDQSLTVSTRSRLADLTRQASGLDRRQTTRARWRELQIAAARPLARGQPRLWHLTYHLLPFPYYLTRIIATPLSRNNTPPCPHILSTLSRAPDAWFWLVEPEWVLPERLSKSFEAGDHRRVFLCLIRSGLTYPLPRLCRYTLNTSKLGRGHVTASAVLTNRPSADMANKVWWRGDEVGVCTSLSFPNISGTWRTAGRSSEVHILPLWL